MPTANLRRGYILGLSAYVIWGIFPLYFKAIANVPAAEIIIHRVLWSALFGTLLLMVWKHPGWWRELRENPKRLAILALERHADRRQLADLRLVGEQRTHA